MKRKCMCCCGPTQRAWPRRRWHGGNRWANVYLCESCWASRNCYTCASLNVGDAYPCSRCLPVSGFPHWRPCKGRVKEAK